MGKFNSYDHFILWVRTIRRNGGALIVNKRDEKCSPGQSRKEEIILAHFQSKSFNITVICLCPNHRMWKKVKLTSSIKTYKTF